jgi:hypothetical protein
MRACQTAHAAREPPRRFGQGPRDVIAQHAGLTGEEIKLIAYLQREQVPRVSYRDIFKGGTIELDATCARQALRGATAAIR